MGKGNSEQADLEAYVESGALELVVPEADLEFKVRVPPGCVIVAALRLPSGQLIELTDLSAEDAAGVEVGVAPKQPGVATGPVNEEKIRAAREVEREARLKGRVSGDPDGVVLDSGDDEPLAVWEAETEDGGQFDLEITKCELVGGPVTIPPAPPPKSGLLDELRRLQDDGTPDD